ncbi:RAxF-45 family protein [Alkalihalobacillus macyae]|nr:RAxF-45 family protein [Alkalihalobacillus macyae]MDP4549274.1 RAxF-45 family protein [Alkalihalobacillus macyae]
MSNAFVRTDIMEFVSICRAIIHGEVANGTGLSNSNFI